jgi:hypothetical protein
MKTVHLLLLSFLALTIVCFTSCFFDDDDGTSPYSVPEVLWSPTLSTSLIADGSVTLQWEFYSGILTEYGVKTKSVMVDYINPDIFEVYQSDQPNDGFTKIAEIKNENKDVSFKVNNLRNGKTVYFLVKSLRKGYETTSSGPYAFIPNPRPESEVVLSSGQIPGQVSLISMSPAGGKIAYYHNEDKSLYICNADGTGIQSVTNDVNAYTILWNHDGSVLYFKTHGSAQPLLKSYDCTSGEITTVMDKPVYEQGYSVSPDGTKVLYNRNSNAEINLYLYNVETGRDSLIMSRNLGGNWMEYIDPVWIDNEYYMVKKTKVNTPYNVSLSLFSYKENKEETLIGEYSRNNRQSALSPDRKHVAYIDYTYDPYGSRDFPRLMLYNMETKSLRQLSGYESDWFANMYCRITWQDNRTVCYTEHSYTDRSSRIVSVSIP